MKSAPGSATRRFRDLLLAGICSAALLSSSIAVARAGGGVPGTPHYTLGMSMVLSGTLGPLGRGMLHGAQLAVMQRDQSDLRQLSITVSLRALDDATSGPRDAQNARTFIKDPTVFAEDGPYNSGAAAVSMPVYNRAGLVQLSPGNTSPDLTNPRFLSQYQPATATQGRGRTYFRDCTTDAYQGPAAVDFAAHHFHLTTAYIVTDQGLPGIGVANAYQQAMPKAGIKLLGRANLDQKNLAASIQSIVASVRSLHPGAVFYGGDPNTGGTELADALRQAGLNMPLIGHDSLLVPTWVVGSNGMYHPGSRNSWFTVIGSNPLRDPHDHGFTAAYRAEFHANPTAFSVLAYDAANIEIDALVKAYQSGSRSGQALRDAVRAYVASNPYHGVGGNGHFNANGDTTNRVISIYRVNGSTGNSFQWLGYAPGFAPNY